MSTIIAIAVLLWGIVPTVEFAFEFHNNPNAQLAQVGVVAGTCHGGFYEPWWDEATPDERLRVVAHEIGHCYGLDHYGDCNSFPTSMGCPLTTLPTEYDLLRLEVSTFEHRVVVGPWAND